MDFPDQDEIDDMDTSQSIPIEVTPEIISTSEGASPNDIESPCPNCDKFIGEDCECEPSSPIPIEVTPEILPVLTTPKRERASTKGVIHKPLGQILGILAPLLLPQCCRMVNLRHIRDYCWKS